MKSVFFNGLDRWRKREIDKVWHYRHMLKQDNLQGEEKKIIEDRIKDLNELIGNINKVYNREDDRKPCNGGEDI